MSTKESSSGSTHVVARLVSSTTLDGAFRIHVPPDSLEQARLKVGEFCEIKSDDGTHGYGIAWRADDRMTNKNKTRPMKMSDTFMGAFGFKEGNKATMTATKVKPKHAKEVRISDDVSSDDSSQDANDDCLWYFRTGCLLGNCEALAVGVSFDVLGKKKIRRRFRIESVSFGNETVSSNSLFFMNDKTRLVMPVSIEPDQDETNPRTANMNTAVGNAPSSDAKIEEQENPNIARRSISTESVGGLRDQVSELNHYIQRILRPTPDSRMVNRPILIHGYAGTGKSMLLKLLAQCSFNKVLRLDRSTLDGGSVSKNKAIIREIFSEAKSEQPSLILMDNLEQLVPDDDTVYGNVLAEELVQINGLRVMVVGATRKPSDLKNAILGSRCFTERIELPIPDQAAREQVLRIMCDEDTDGELCATIASKTHGFTCADLDALHYHADNYASVRSDNLYSAHLASTEASSKDAWSVVLAENRPIRVEDFMKALASQKVKPAALLEILTEKPKVGWNDIGGSEEMKERFDEIIGWPLQHKTFLSNNPSYRPTKGVLLYGPPGCSKTLTAQAIANTYDLNFIAIKGASLISMYVGESERAVRDVFSKARLAAPCAIFFDEIDSIGADRDGGGTKGLNVLTTLLNEMDGFEPLSDVLILAATNKPESLDPALIRPGRFDQHVYLGPPNAHARKDILEIATRGNTVEVDLDSLALDLDGHSGAEIVGICQNALKNGLRRKFKGFDSELRLTQEDFSSARKNATKGITQEMLDAYKDFANREG